MAGNLVKGEHNDFIVDFHVDGLDIFVYFVITPIIMIYTAVLLILHRQMFLRSKSGSNITIYLVAGCKWLRIMLEVFDIIIIGSYYKTSKSNLL